MNHLFTLLLMLFVSVSYAENDLQKVCVNIPGRGLSNDKIEKTCQKGDLIKVDEKNLPFLCDFNYAIAPYNQNHVCVYTGQRRELREGTNF